MTANPTLLSMPLAQNGQKNVIPETQATAGDGLFSQSTGFPAETSLPLGAGGVAPSREDFNGMANLLGGVAFYAQKGWQFQFDAGQAYYAGCIVRDTTDGKLYECLNDVAAGGSVPSADSVNWKLYEFAPIASPTFTGTPKAPTASAGTNTTQIATTEFVQSAVGNGIPAGTILPFGGSSTPSGFLLCDGSAVSRTTYSALYSAIGTTWGGGNGSTTFNLPSITDGRFLEGSSAAGTKHSAGVPNITGAATAYEFVGYSNPTNTPGGFSDDGKALYFDAVGNTSISTSGKTLTTSSGASTGISAPICFNAARSSNIYGNSTTVQPKSATVRYIIKY